MSPVSRGRKVKRTRRSARRSGRPFVVDARTECDCPACSAAGVEPRQYVDALALAAADLAGSPDPLDAEIMGATLASIGYRAGERFADALILGIIPELEARASLDALAMLLAIGSVDRGQFSPAASAAAARLVEVGVPRPGWAAELGDPVTVADCRRLSDSEGNASMLACSFHRAGRAHAVVISVDEQDCGAARDIHLLDADGLPHALQMLRTLGHDEGLEITDERLDAVEFRWQVEKALDARTVHDNELSEVETDGLLTEEGRPGYSALAVLLRARMNTLPTPARPAAPHGVDNEEAVRLATLRLLAQLTPDRGGPFGPGMPAAASGRKAVSALPAKRKKSARPAPVYQIKVSLRGAKPPIWRRLEVAADISLARLHTVIQVAFGWDDSHLHVFETPYGRFGTDAGLGHRAETSVTLEQVASAPNSKLHYTYDFGDNWDHDILVERVFESNETVAYPRCTGGRRAAPPDDCGGIWGYADLVQVLTDPADEEHEDRLEWLGLAAAAEFDPDRFDAEEVTRVLSLVN